MARALITVPLDDGTAVLVEVEAREDAIVRAGRPGEVIGTLKETFENALEPLRGVAHAVVASLSGLPDHPDQIEVGFGIKIDAEARVVVAHAGAEGNFSVILRWNPR